MVTVEDYEDTLEQYLKRPQRQLDRYSPRGWIWGTHAFHMDILSKVMEVHVQIHVLAVTSKIKKSIMAEDLKAKGSCQGRLPSTLKHTHFQQSLCGLYTKMCTRPHWTSFRHLGPKQSPLHLLTPLLCRPPFFVAWWRTPSLHVHQTRGQHLLLSTLTRGSKRHGKGQAEIKCAFEKSTHKTSRASTGMLNTHLQYYNTNTHTCTFDMAECLKVRFVEAGIMSMGQFGIWAVENIEWEPTEPCRCKLQKRYLRHAI